MWSLPPFFPILRQLPSVESSSISESSLPSSLPGSMSVQLFTPLPSNSKRSMHVTRRDLPVVTVGIRPDFPPLWFLRYCYQSPIRSPVFFLRVTRGLLPSLLYFHEGLYFRPYSCQLSVVGRRSRRTFRSSKSGGHVARRQGIQWVRVPLPPSCDQGRVVY